MFLAQGQNASAVQDPQQQNQPDQDVRPDNSLRKDLPDFAQITPSLYRGAQASREGFRKLAAMGVQIVIDLRGDRKSEREFVNTLGMTYIPMGWECSFPKDKTFAKFLAVILDNPGKKIFIHCRVGDDRTGMMIAAFRMAVQGWSAEHAEKEMERFGFDFLHRRVICPRLSSYEEHFPDRFRTKPDFRELRERMSGAKPD
ncbi:MAG TPA: tyrosine-protein phosphatase [Candidatus Acidoferrales bacterium]|nr:tyrosine-protein phosphatase [Candidatus Acidoferrales bacterium]